MAGTYFSLRDFLKKTPRKKKHKNKLKSNGFIMLPWQLQLK